MFSLQFYIFILFPNPHNRFFKVLLTDLQFHNSGQSKSLTFEDGVEAGTAAAEASEEEKNKKTPEACCPSFIHK